MKKPVYQIRSSWEVIYSKFSVQILESSPAVFYMPIDNTHGASWICCNIEIDDLNYILNICGTTWYPKSRHSMNEMINSIKSHINVRSMKLISISTGEFGSELIVPRGLSDTWTELNSPIKCQMTLDEKLSTYMPESNCRADHLWNSGLFPSKMNLINSDGNAEHHGLYAEYVIINRSYRCVFTKQNRGPNIKRNVSNDDTWILSPRKNSKSPRMSVKVKDETKKLRHSFYVSIHKEKSNDQRCIAM